MFVWLDSLKQQIFMCIRSYGDEEMEWQWEVDAKETKEKMHSDEWERPVRMCVCVRVCKGARERERRR